MAKRVLVQYTSHWNGSRVAFTAETWEREADRLVCHGCRTLAGIQMAPTIKVDLVDKPEISGISGGSILLEPRSEH